MIEQGFRLSPAQRRLWSIQGPTPGAAAYGCRALLRIEGEIDSTGISRALRRVVERNEILRTAFPLLPGMTSPLQVVQSIERVGDIRLREIDLIGLSAPEIELQLDGLLDAAARDAFDLERGEVFRALLVRTAPREQSLVLALPALCSDPVTLRNLAGEIARALAVERDVPEDGDEPPLQYADVAEWQHQLLESPDTEEGIERWRERWRERRIAEAMAVRLPLEEPLGEPLAGELDSAFRPAAVGVPLSGELRRQLQSLIDAWGCMPRAFLLACWQALLGHSTGLSEIVVGVLFEGRGYEELETALGPLAAYLPVPARLDGSLSLREAVARAQRDLAEAEAGQESFDWERVLGGDGGTSPSFPFCFAAEDGPESWESRVDGLRLSLSRPRAVLDRFDVELAGAGLAVLELRYDRRRFRRATAERLAERLGALLESVAARPETPLAELEMLGERERRTLAELSRSAPVVLQDGLIHRRFEEQARRTPDRPAVVWNGASLSYSELNAEADRLARRLRRRLRRDTVGPETPVGICLPRSASMVAAVLGVLKAGGAWVPLDPALPLDRLRFILEDTGARVVVSEEGILAPELLDGRRLVGIDSAEGDASKDEELSEAPAGGLAYIIYTSGSTGRPKGVLVEHAAPINLLAALQEAALPSGPEPLRASLNAPLAFDASVQQLVLLLAGHTLYVIPDEVRTDGVALLAFLAEHEIDLFDCTPSQLRLLLGAGLLETDARAPGTFLVAGEAIEPPMWDALAGSARTAFFNIYGPTECTVDATWRRVTPGEPSIGRPLLNYEAYLIDSGSRQVPFGAPGEILLGGAGLARGYAGRPDLTAERFVPHPFSDRPGARLYRTGDLGRHRPGGGLEFLGRVDHQVKIRGYRIELGEIETVLARHPWVREAVVAVRQDAAGAPAIVGYVIPTDEAPAGFAGAHTELHRFLRETLPVYMVPAAFVALAAFPLTPSGKVDRRALPDPEPERSGRSSSRHGLTGFVAPRNAVEETLAAIWCKTLQLERVGVEDNFFALGGDSILSIQVISRAALAGLRISARQMFEHQTIARLAEAAERIGADAAREEKEEDATGPAPLTPIQSAFLERGLPHAHHFNQSILLDATERVSVPDLRGALVRLLDAHEALRTRFREDGPTIAPPDSEPPLMVIDLSGLPDDRRCGALTAAAGQVQGSLDLAAGPVLRTALFPMDRTGRVRLLLVAHHLVVDGVSWRILLEDLEAAYRGRELPPGLSSGSTSFRIWAWRLAAHAGSPELAAELPHWLAQRSVPRRLPVDTITGEPAGENTVSSSGTVRVSLGADETRALLQDVPRAFHTQINDALLTALAEAFAGWTGSRRLRVDLEGHGREDLFDGLSVARTVGWFTTVFPVLIDLEGILEPGEALRTVKETLRAVPGRGLGFGLLRYLGPAEAREALKEVPSAEVIFNYLGQLDPAAAGDRLLRLASEPAGETRHPAQPREHLLEINGSVAGGRLWLDWTYSRNRHRAETVEALAERYLAALRGLIADCAARAIPRLTPSDVALAVGAGLDARALDRLQAALGAEVEDLYPLSPLQEGMLFHSLDDSDGVYVRRWSFTLEGDLDPEAFRAACQRVVDRHPILRTAFLWRDLREPLQAVMRRVEVPFIEIREGFDLGTAPLLRLSISPLGPRTWRVVWTFHHLVLDGWSFPRLVAEVFAEYGGAADRPRTPPPFRDYIAWLRRQDLGAAEAFWRRELDGFAMVTPIAADRDQRPEGAALLETGADRLQIWLPIETTAALQDWARRGQLTLNSVVQSAWALLLWRYGGERDVVFGSVSSGRNAPLPGIESMLGVFINTLPTRAAVDPDAEPAAWMRALQERQSLARELEHSPLARVQGWSGLPRGQALFESLFVFENYPVEETVQADGGSGRPGRLRILDVDLPETTNYPLSLMAAPGPRLLLRLVWDRARFDRTSIARRLDHLGTILEGLLDHEGTLDDLPLLSAAERHQLLEWNATGTIWPPVALSLPGLVGGQVVRTPDATAVTFEGKSLTYAELWDRAGRLASLLAGRGVKPDDLVGLRAERSLGLVVGLLGILRAGAAYVPIDPGYPADRIAFLLEDSGVAVLLDDTDVSDISAGDTDVDKPSSGKPLEPAVRIDPDGLAYMIYTSGSTGRPKGAMNSHRAIRNRLLWMQAEYGLTAEDRVLQKTPFSFDVSVWEFFWPLMVGARLVVALPGGHQDPAYLVETIVREGITTLHFVPSMLRMFLDAPGGDRCAGLKRVICSGEALPPDLARRFAEILPGVELHNLYGPTEAAVDVTAWPCREEGRSVISPMSVPIGRPIANTAIHILDASFRPVPIGVSGELLIGGIQPARGYHRRPDLTAEKFIPDPFGVPGARAYRTGDLARWRPDGAVEYLGRIDFQVKIRGVRIEPGEIEIVLAEMPGVREAVVAVRDDLPGGRALVAFVVLEAEADTAALRARLRERLPEAMVPSRVVVLDGLPLTPNGKADRRALERRPLEREDGAGRVEPRTPAEEILAGIFEEVLQIGHAGGIGGVGRVGASDDFFALGGHSLLATQAVSRIRSAFGVELPLRALFDAPTVAGLAEALERLGRATDGAVQAPPILPIPRSEMLPLSFAQERLWFLDQLDPGSPVYNVPLALGLRGDLSRPALADALTALVDRHEALRSAFPTVDGRPELRIAAAVPTSLITLPVVDLRALPPAVRSAAADRLAADEARRPFDLGRGPLVRALLLRTEDDLHAALLTLHHIVSDGWSLGVLVRELGALYGAFLEGRASALPTLPVQYADFAAWQRAWLTGDVLAAQLGWWRERLAGLPPVLTLPLDRPRPAVQGHRAEQVQVRLGAGLSEGIARLARERGATPYIVLLAALQALLGRLAGQDDLAVGSPIANRNRSETEGLIGFFVNTLVLRGRLEDDPPFDGWLARVRETALGAYGHQDVPFERLVEELHPERSLTHTPLFQVMLILQNAPLGALELPGLTLEPFGVGREGREVTTKFDLTLALEDTPGGLAGSLRYNPDLFDRTTAIRLTLHLETLLAVALARPDARLSALPHLCEAERHQLVAEWNDTADGAPEIRLHDLVTAQAHRTPDAVALEFEGAELTYGELDRWSGRLAAHLRSLGVGPETPVGIALERSLEMPVALLSVLRAGGAYLPLDPELPVERRDWILADARPRVVLTRHDLKALHDLPDAEAPEVDISPDALACILYTSGSTGRPKGVGLPHRGLVNRMVWAQRAYPLDGSDRVLQKAPFFFDFSIWETFGPLMAGARVVLASPGGQRDAAYLVSTIAERGITAVHFVPSLLRVFLDEDGLERCGSLRLVFSGGEALTSYLRDRAAARLGLPLRNQYGPTEASVDVSYWLCTDTGKGGVPIGRPIDNLRLHVVDRSFRLAGVSAAGELCFGGVGLARGYMNRPDLTAERFVPDPWSGRPGERLYRSGDLARRLPGGEIEVIGRTDQQVKIRGLRIELGEIEALLAEHPGVREAAVTVRDDGAAARLVGYVVGTLSENDEDTEADLLRFLEPRLPAYMVPSAFVTLPALPRTPSGKVDRRALPAPERRARTFQAPATAVERDLAEVWAEVLRLPEVGADDNFFALGGDSILSIQVVARAARRGIRITPRQVFEHQTIAGLAAVAGLAGTGAEIPQGPVTGPVPLTPIQRRFLGVDPDGPVDPGHFAQSVLLSVKGVSPRDVESALAVLAVHHDALRLRFVRELQGWKQWNAAPAEAPPAWGQIDLSGLPKERLKEGTTGELTRATASAQAGMDLAAGPTLRGLWLDLSGGESRLFLAAHHLVVDGVSWRILLEDLETACRGEAIAALPPKTTSFQRWAEHLAARAVSFAAAANGIAAAANEVAAPANEVAAAANGNSSSQPSSATAANGISSAANEAAAAANGNLTPASSFAAAANKTAAAARENSSAEYAELAWWIAESRGDSVRLPLDRADASELEASTRWSGGAASTLSAEETRSLLQDLPAAFRTQVNDALLTALALALAGPGQALKVDLEGHGREEGDSEGEPEIDLSRTVGWFTTVFPVRLAVPAGATPAAALLAVKEHLRELPGRGLGYGLLGLDEQAPEISFNYLGQFDQVLAGDSPFTRAGEPTGPPRSPRARRSRRLDVVGLIAGGRLRVDWGHGDALERATVERIAARFADALRGLIALGRSAVEARTAAYTPSDFPLARLDRAALTALLGTEGGMEWGIEDIYPLSPLQEGILFHTLYHPGSGVYVGQILARLRGDLDAAAFAEACRRLTARQPILRTSFHGGRLDRALQVVHGVVEPDLTFADWRGRPELDRDLAAAVAADRERGFDLERPPLLRWTLIRTGESEHRLLWTHHHLLLDGWSLSALIGELVSLYTALREGRSAELPPRRPYRDYVAWLERWPPDASEAYWRRALGGWSEPTPLPPGRPDRGAGTEVHQTALGPDVTAALETQARRHQLTLNTLVQGAWALLLGRYAGLGEAVFGATVSGRPAELPGVESMIGLFINTLPVRVGLDPGRGVLAWLRALQIGQVELREHEQSPLVRVQEWSGVPAGRPLFETILVFESYPQDEAMRQGGSGLGVTEVQASEQTHYPLTAIAIPGASLLLRLEVLRTHYDAESAARIAGHFANLLAGLAAALAAGGAEAVGSLPWLSPAEMRQILHGWNPEPGSGPGFETVLDGMAGPSEAPAIVFGGEILTYAGLHDRAGRLAGFLRRSGAGPGARVAVALERSIDLPVAVLGVLKAGAACVPLDPAYPAERLTFMLEDARVPVLLTQESLLDRLPAFSGRTVALDRDREAIAALPSGPEAAAGVWRESPAYLIYTSGSTGRPKGAVMTHGTLANLLDWHASQGLAAPARTLQFAPISFDVSFQEMLTAWWSGGSLHLVSEETRRDPEALLDLLAEQGIERLYLPFVALRQLAEAAAGRPGRPDPPLHDVITAGEQLQVTPAVAAWLGRLSGSQLPGCRLHNHYGPSETHVVTAHVLAGDSGLWPALPPIGRPVAATRVHLLRPGFEPVPAGVAAELWVGGAAVGQGYHDRPDLTAERFLPDPWGEGGRLYRTGDLARYGPDGILDYLGRADQQVKIRGHRIEPGEVEAALAACPGVRQATVAVREDLPGGRALVAWIVPEDEPGPGPLSAADLRAALRSRLPEPMIPSHFERLASLPLTPSGKVDRKALAGLPLAALSQDGGRGEVHPASPAEELLAGIFAAVLGRDSVGVDDGFFDLGGHSLLAMQVVSRVRSTFGVEMPLRELFEAPVVRALARRLETLRRDASAGPAAGPPPLVPVPRAGTLPLSFAQERLWLLHRLDPGSAAYNMPAALGLRGRLERAALDAALGALATRHESLRTRLTERGGRPVQEIDPPAADVAVPLIDLSGLPEPPREAAAQALAADEALRPFDLARGPLLRAALVKLEEERHLGLFTLHHAISDGWSMGVLVSELGELYAAAAERRRPSLPPLPVQSADVAVWQRAWLEGEVMRGQLDWWREQLAGAPPALDLPFDRPRPASPRFRGAQVATRLPAGLSRRLAALGRERGATLFMVLLAGFQAVLARLAGQEDVVVGSAVANRPSVETEGLIGFFVNVLPFRGLPRGGSPFAEHLVRVREATLGAYAHQDVPFERLVEELQPERSLAHSPIFQVLLVLQNAPMGALELPGITLETVPGRPRSAKYDLTLALTEGAGGLTAAWEHDSDLFDASTVARWAGAFERLLAAACERPGDPLASLELLSEAERHQLVREWNDTPAVESLSTFSRLFESRADRDPDAVAVLWRSGELTYGDLDRRANRVARHLRRLGVGAGSLVGLAMERSPDLLAGLLGIWKAGAAYVPLDPAYPAERLALIAGDTGLRLVVSHGGLPERLGLPGVAFVRLDADRDAIDREEDGRLGDPADPETVAYVIHTSGSTGRPKGVAVPHRGLVSFAREQSHWMGLRPGSRLLPLASLSFDGSVAEIAIALASGSTLVLASREETVPGPDLIALLRERRINHVNLPPSALAVLPEIDLPDLRCILVAGEACPPDVARRWARGRRLLNGYGPT